MERLKAMTDPVIKGPRPFVKEWKKHAIGKDFMVYNFSIDFYFIFLKTLLVRAKVLNGSENIVFRYEGVKVNIIEYYEIIITIIMIIIILIIMIISERCIMP